MESNNIVVDSPYSGGVVATVARHDSKEQAAILEGARAAQLEWKGSSLTERQQLCHRFLQEVEKRASDIALAVSQQMGKPLKQARGEVDGMAFRARTMIELSNEALSSEQIADGVRIEKEPVGVVLLIAPWNYPLLTAVNCLVPAVLAGNSVLIKHSPRTPLCSEALADAFAAAGAPRGLVSALHTADPDIHALIEHEAVQFVSFTGSVEVGHKIYRSVANKRFIDCTLELGGKDAAYVAPDADLKHAVASLVDGAMYNSGQSCCGIERVYVHQSLYDKFVEAATAEVTSTYVLGDPLDDKTNLGPMALPQAPAFLHHQITDAVHKGAVLTCGGSPTTDTAGKGRFFQPTVIANCRQDLDLMQRESFGPVLAIQSVASDAEAVARINDSVYGLTGAVYTSDPARADLIGSQLRVGTVFMNRCDYLDPRLPWTGLKDSGKGVSLSRHGFRGLTRLKGYNFRHLTA